MTIHELLQAAGLTANDEIPIWDVDGTGEPTKKITAQQLAAAVVALANLVTGVKGNAESNYRHGDVNLTPANIGAVAKSGDTMTGNLTIKNPTANTNTQFSVQTTKNSGAVTIRVDQEGGNIIILSPNGKEFQIDAYNDNTIRVYSYDDSSPAVIKAVTFNRLTGALSATGGFSGNATNVTGTVAVTHGGTGATTPAAARANLEITPANIGALPISGGTMSGDIDMGQAGASSGAPSVKWRTADGTLFSFRPYGNAFQLVRGEGSSASSVLTINSDGTLYVNPQANWRSALGVVPSIVSLTAGANVSLDWQSSVAVSGVLIFNANVTVNSAITGSGKTVLTLPSGYKAASASSPFLSGRVNGATHQLYIAANGTSIITGFGATNIPAGDYVLSGVILLG